MEALEKNNVFRSFPGLSLACGMVVIFALFISRYFMNPLGHDQSAYLLEAQRTLSGAVPYGPHLAETNPPLIIWFSSIPVLLGLWMHGSAVLFFRLLVIGMMFGSVAWCVRLSRRNAAMSNPVAVGLLCCAILMVENSLGSYDFGQREHLLIVLLLPYILAVATGVVNRISFAERCALGVVAGIAIWFKPQDTLVLIGLELFLSFRARNIRRALAPEVLALVLSSCLVLVLVVVLTPRYITETLPLLLDTYWALGTKNTLALALSLHIYMACVLVMFLAFYLFRNSLRSPATLMALVICSIAASFAFDIQHTEWPYHAYPHWALLLLALAYALIDYIYPVISEFSSDLRLFRRMALVTCGLMAVLLCVIAIHRHVASHSPTQSGGAELDRFLAQYRPATTVYIFSTSVLPLYSAYNHQLNWGSRFVHLWMMPAIIQNELGPTGPPAPFKRLTPETLARLAALQRTETAEDLNYWKPSVVLVQHCSLLKPCQGIEGKDFNMLSWFLQSPGFAAAWSHYQWQPGLHDFDVYNRVR